VHKVHFLANRYQILRGAYVVGALAALVAYPLLSVGGRQAALVIAAAVTIIPVASALRRTASGHRLGWLLLLAGQASLLVSTTLTFASGGLLRAPVRVLGVAGYLLLLAAAMTLVLNHGRNNLGVVIDTAIAALAAGGVLWTLVFRPHLPAGSTHGVGRLGLLLIILCLLATLGAVIQLDRIRPGSALAELIGAVLFALGGNVQFAIEPDEAARGGMFFIAAYLCLGLFGLNPKAQALLTAAPPRPERLSIVRLVLLGVAITITPALLGVQLLAGGERDGLLLLVSPAAITVLVVVRIGQLTAQRDRAEHALQLQATHDALTGLPNRREFHTQLERLSRTRRRPAILFCDLDRFKAINDRYGHAGGDELLSQVAQRLRNSVRAEDVVCRYGGDEFVVVLPDVAATELEVTRQRIDLVLREPFHVDGQPVVVGASIGSAMAGARETPAELITLADHSMYDQKLRRKSHRLAAGTDL
jgi:diguanylate cyclase (GGDEF)-like protein